jgi:hypothetical protein
MKIIKIFINIYKKRVILVSESEQKLHAFMKRILSGVEQLKQIKSVVAGPDFSGANFEIFNIVYRQGYQSNNSTKKSQTQYRNF